MRLAIGAHLLQKQNNLNSHKLFANLESAGAKWLTDNLSANNFRSIRGNMCFNGYQHLRDLGIDAK